MSRDYMTTKNFLTIVQGFEDLSYQVFEKLQIIEIYNITTKECGDSFHCTALIIRMDKMYAFNNNFEGFYKLDKKIQEVLYSITDKYARTLVEEREEREKYYLVLDEINNELYKYINYDRRSGRIFPGEKHQTTDYKTHFTDEEIEILIKKIPKAIGVAKKVKV